MTVITATSIAPRLAAAPDVSRFPPLVRRLVEVRSRQPIDGVPGMDPPKQTRTQTPQKISGAGVLPRPGQTNRRTPEGEEAHTGGEGWHSWPKPKGAVRANFRNPKGI